MLHTRWVEEINKHVPVKFVPGKDSLLCCEHFSADMFYVKDGWRQKAKLKPFAVAKQGSIEVLLTLVQR